ncbi:TonB-dependent siderophore receptor [Vibrio crassostreae]|uniref:TonB-dependent siderophore receptor n=1 Tax=Vibrio crassostreae TaxID=246167 RepID=UPI000634FEE6|nr:TonB-dependent siderophore receptor [Vibrio crassostreae]TCO06289.1 iron complex outermembrane receptor protein [Vibrio crassostreae]CAK1731540.1 iron complex outermembrane recepter protein [Vibrio crassostreae]CAK1856159.1 iron complex outermembrane recepter protein [Vibrio crassostreae]CAK1857967.1 iron complex outermembrane recepter protein [Vibrio crassostreae]CAK1895422.1 iron complex outermembrane recepter protein [Vibrio crassostreae]
MTTHTRFKYSSLAVALLTAFSAQALAEETVTAADSNIETVTIMGKAYRNTATKSALEPEETPQGITVIDEEQLEQRGVKSLNQALRYAPGVVTEQKGASVTMYDTFSIRGFSNNQSYYDGLVLPFLTGWNLQPQIDPIAIQQVEVFKGPTSVLYGSMPPGGMVNMIAKTPQEDGSTKVGVSTGSRNLMEASIDTSGQLGDSDFSYRLVALARKQDSQVDNAEEERYVIAPSLDWQVSDRTLINFNLYYQNDPSMGTNSAMPLEVLKASDPSVSMGDKNWSTFEREVLMLGYKINHQINDNWTFLQNARYTDASLYQENTYHTATNFNPATGSLIRNAYSTDEDSQSFVIDNQVSGRVEVAGLEHNLLFGLDYLKLTGDSLYQEFTANAGFYDFNAYNPNNDLLDKSQLQENYRESHDITTEQLGLYFQDQVRYDALVLLAGGRYDMFKASDDKTSTYPTNDGTEKADHNQFSYRVGALYELDNGISPFVSYATSFEPAAGTDINGNSLKPQLGEQVELGVKYLSADMAQQLTASYFYITKKDSIAADPSDPTYRSKIQLGEVRSQGVEVEGRWFVTEDWDVNASYTYVDMEVTEDATPDLEGTTPIYVPTHAANLWSNYYVYGGALAGTRWSAGVRYMGEMEMDATNTQGKVPSYTVVDLSVGYDLGEASDTLSGATANLLVNNLFNEEYYTCYDQSNCWFGAEQSVELSVNYEF